jgi:Tfp pilus assembly protein PilF
MRGYRALLAAGGPDQPLLLERILALAAARSAWFFDGLELSRQALGRWPGFPPAHAALASITLAQGDAREAAGHLTQLAQLASAEGDDDQAALAALAGARLLRVLEPRSATQLYQLALEHDPGSAEAADSLADRLADEQRWPELVRLLRARASSTQDAARSVQLRLRLADVLVHQLGDLAGAQEELAAARALAPDEPAVHEMTAAILTSHDPHAAVEEWRAVGRLAEARGDHRTAARAWATLGELVASGAPAGDPGESAAAAWQRALELDPLQADALAGLAGAAAAAGDHAAAAVAYERLRGLGLAQQVAARHELQLARSLTALGRVDDARSSLRRATLAGGETAAEAHAILAELAGAASDAEQAAAELDTAIAGYVDHAAEERDEGPRLHARAAELAIARARLLDGGIRADRADRADAAPDREASAAAWQRAHELARPHAPELARTAARTLLERAGDDLAEERRWIDAVLATRPPAIDRAVLLVRRADARRRGRTPELPAALADLHEALRLTADIPDEVAIETRRRAFQLEAELRAQSGDQRARAQALAALAQMPAVDRVQVETAAAAAWLTADDPAAALPHAARAYAALAPDAPEDLRREALVTLGEAAWRQRSWPDVMRAYGGLIGADAPERGGGLIGADAPGTFRYRFAVAGDRTGEGALAMAALRPLIEDLEAARALPPELRGQALRLYADLAERAGDLGGAAAALESFAALAVESSITARADATYRAGELFRRAHRTEEALRCLEATLRISETHLPALDALEAMWRERGDVERVAAILGRKVAATARHPSRQKPLLSRLGDLQAQLGRPEIALATHQRALEIDPAWRPSLQFVTVSLRDAGQVVAAAGGFAQLAGELPGDPGADLAVVVRERQAAAAELARVVAGLDDAQVEAVRAVAQPALERAAQGGGDGAPDAALAAALARLRGEPPGRPQHPEQLRDEDTSGRRRANAAGTARSLRDAAERERAAGKLGEALATLETANHVNPGDAALVRDLVDLAMQLGDHEAAARHLTALAALLAGARRGDALLELADLCYDRLDDVDRGRRAMRDAAEAFGSGARRDTALRMLAAETAANLAWDLAVEALSAIEPARRSKADVASLVNALRHAGHDADAIALLRDATAAGRYDDGGELLHQLEAEAARKAALAQSLEERARAAAPDDASELRAEARELRHGAELRTRDTVPPFDRITIEDPDASRTRTKTDRGIGSRDKQPASTEPHGESGRPEAPREPRPEPAAVRASAIGRIKLVSVPARGATERNAVVPPPVPPVPPPATELPLPPPPAASDDEEAGWAMVTNPRLATPRLPLFDSADDDYTDTDPEITKPSVVISGTAAETASALAAAAASADRSQLVAAWRANPGDPAVLLALLAHLGEREPALRREVLEEAAGQGEGRAPAIALHELGILAREAREPSRAAALWTRAWKADPGYAPVWMMLADALAAADDLDAARELYEQVAASGEYDATRRAFAAERAEALSRDESIVSGEIRPRATVELERARQLALAEDWRGAIAAAERAASHAPAGDTRALELLEELFLEQGDVTASSEAIGRQLVVVEDAARRAALWRRRARLYRDALGRDAEAYRCLKEAQACAPADPEIAYQLRVAAMVRGEWALAASLLYREIAAAGNPRDRGALHLELALIYEERLDDDAQAQVNYEQALAFDPTIPAAKLPLARRYDAIGRHAEAARLFEEAAAAARAGDRAQLLEAAARARNAASGGAEPDLPAQLERAEAVGDLDAALDLAHLVWRDEPGNAIAFRVLAKVHRSSGDLAALADLTSVRARLAETPDERAAAWLEVARLAEELDALDQAARAYDLALIEDPGHIAALDARGALAFRIGDHATADLIYRDLAGTESILGEDELAVRRSIIAEHLGRDGEALAHAQAAVRAAPGRRDLLVRVQALATRLGELEIAIEAARGVLDLVPLDDDEAQLQTQFALVDLLRQSANIGGAIAQLERVLRDHPIHTAALEALTDLHIARNDWPTATRYLYQLVPLAPTASQRAERLYRLGDAVLVHLGDTDRADDAFLRASDLDPGHVPTLRRLLDVYWRADDPGALVEVAAELADKGALASGATPETSLAHALVAAALVGDTQLAQRLGAALGDDAPRRVATALAELEGRDGRLGLANASTAVAELARRGLLDLAEIRAAAAGTPVAGVLGGA